MNKVILFSNGCPRCKILKEKFDRLGLDYVESSDFQELVEQGFQSVPVVKTLNGDYKTFDDIMNELDFLIDCV